MLLKIFLVEDSQTIRENLVPTLESLTTARVIAHAETQAEALQWLEDHPTDWDLSVVDLFLRQGSGLGILSRLTRARKTQRLVVLTNYATSDIRERCLKLGADAVFDKSAELEEFLEYCRQAPR
ncbi:MAG: response regulator transcription factor [Variovorax sp.]